MAGCLRHDLWGGSFGSFFGGLTVSGRYFTLRCGQGNASVTIRSMWAAMAPRRRARPDITPARDATHPCFCIYIYDQLGYWELHSVACGPITASA